MQQDLNITAYFGSVVAKMTKTPYSATRRAFQEDLSKELFNASLRAKLIARITADPYLWDNDEGEAVRTPIPGVVVEILFEMLRRYPRMRSLTVEMDDGICLEASYKK